MFCCRCTLVRPPPACCRASAAPESSSAASDARRFAGPPSGGNCSRWTVLVRQSGLAVRFGSQVWRSGRLGVAGLAPLLRQDGTTGVGNIVMGTAQIELVDACRTTPGQAGLLPHKHLGWLPVPLRHMRGHWSGFESGSGRSWAGLVKAAPAQEAPWQWDSERTCVADVVSECPEPV